MRTLIKIGDEYALVITQEQMDQLKIQPNTPLDVAVVDGALHIRPLDPSERARIIKESVDRVNAKFGNALRNMGPE